MLEFKKDSDFLLVDSFVEREDGAIKWRYQGHGGFIAPGFPTPFDDNGEPIDVWGRLLNKEAANEISIQRRTQAQRDEESVQRAVEAFKAQRLANVNTLVVTTSGGKQYQADQTSISAMTARVIALSGQPDTYQLQWSLAPTGTGVMSTVTLGDLKEALLLATDAITSYWDINQ